MCGIVGAAKIKNAGRFLYLMLFVLQHRGQEGAKIITNKHGKEKKQSPHSGLGLVDDVFSEADVEALEGDYGSGHVRYSTTGSADIINNHPLSVTIGQGKNMERLSVAHNGTITTELTGLRMTDTDTEQIIHNFRSVNSDLPIHRRIYQSLKGIHGAFSLIFVYQDKAGNNNLICVRDPQAMRPLCLGKYDGGYLVASESCAFDVIEGATFWRFVKPGEIVVISDDRDKPFSFKPKAWQNRRRASCSFEYIYSSHPSSRVETADDSIAYVYEVQEALGYQLAKENTDIEGDLVVGTPSSSIFHAQGFSQRSRISLKNAILRSHYVGRTFILPEKKNTNGKEDGNRKKKLLKKFSIIKGFLYKRKLVLVDDSIVRCNTMRLLIKLIKRLVGNMLRVTCVIASPIIKFPCYMGNDTPTKKELAFNSLGSVEAIRKHLDVDDLRYISVKGTLDVICKITKFKPNYFCMACFTGEYPVKITRQDFLDELAK